MLALLGSTLRAHFEKGATVTSTEMLTYAEEAIDQVMTKKKMRVAYLAVGVDVDSPELWPLVRPSEVPVHLGWNLVQSPEDGCPSENYPRLSVGRRGLAGACSGFPCGAGHRKIRS